MAFREAFHFTGFYGFHSSPISAWNSFLANRFHGVGHAWSYRVVVSCGGVISLGEVGAGGAASSQN